MTSLPISANWIEGAANPPAPRVPEFAVGGAQAEDENVLLRAFRSFARTARSLEQSYRQLQAEVERLRRELAQKEGDLAASAEERNNERARLIRILEGLPCGVLVIFDNGKIWKANPEACRLLDADHLPAGLDSVAALPASLQQLLTTSSNEGGESELKLTPPSGEGAWIAARSASLDDGMSIFILRDITEHKRLEETQLQLRREQALAEISAILAHEVRNPLGSLELFAGLLADAQLPADHKQWVEHLQAGLRCLSATVNNVLNFHSMSPAQFSSVRARELLEWAFHFCGPLARLSRVTLRVEDCAFDLVFPADRHRLEQVLLNLVLNSIKAMPEGGCIELAARPQANGSGVELSVTDTGTGIPAEYLPRIFTPGFSTRGGSPGLGLAVCRRIVEQHQGTIRAESRPQGGTCFSISFPGARKDEIQ